MAVDPNPGGCTSPSFHASFTAGDNVFVGWGCGTHCSVTALFSHEGNLLRHMDFVDLSPSKIEAVSYPAAPQPIDGLVRLIDLRTGAVVRQAMQRAFPEICSVSWIPGEVVLLPCDPGARTTRLRRPVPRAR